MPVDAGLVDWLKTGAKFEASTDAGIAAAWGADAAETEIVSPLALLADAAAEAVRQEAFLKGPLVIDRHVVRGLKAYLVGRPATITIDRLGYDAGVDVFVIGAEERDGVELTNLTVLRRL
ncbi:MAG TPA: hypothetical protein VEC11_07825 [Allosphingosinicella sp.]|nr:hypothetical protein [Allosphingosinicella sp.]